jgi:adenylylsulfate kinase-like enzyme
MDFNEQQLRTIVREETRQALKEVGLADEDAGNDVRENVNKDLGFSLEDSIEQARRMRHW